MKIAIIASESNPRYYKLLDTKINELIKTSNCFLFSVLSGYIEGQKHKKDTLSEQWAKENGAPLLYIRAKTMNKLINKMLHEADYIIFIIDGNNIVNNALMKYKMMGKHGTVIKA